MSEFDRLDASDIGTGATFAASAPESPEWAMIPKPPKWKPFDKVIITLADGGTVTVKATPQGGYCIDYRDASGAQAASPMLRSIDAGAHKMWWNHE